MATVPAGGEDDNWVSVAAAARALHVHPTTVRRYAAAGKVPYVKTVGGHRRFRVSDLLALQERLRVGADPEPFDYSDWAPSSSSRAPTHPGSPRVKLASGHLAAQPVPPYARLLPQLAWAHDTATRTSRSSGTGWTAEIRPAGAGWEGRLTMDTGEVLRWPADPSADPKGLDRCKRWVRQRLDARAAQARRVRAR
jgi:excisionase family DNA binding protein